MRKEVLMPDVGVSQAKVCVWFAKPGDPVYAGDRLVEVLVGGAAIVVTSPGNGRLIEKTALPDDTLTSGEVLGVVDVEGDGVS